MNESLFQKAKTINPLITEEEFETKRAEALARGGEGHEFAHVGGGVVMDSANLSPEDKEAILESQDHTNNA